MTLPAFHLWHAACERAGGEVVCRFDVTAPELSGLERGDAGIMAVFAESLRLGPGRVRSWSVGRFCTPYYAQDPDAEDWRDRVELAWRVELRLAGEEPFFDYGGLGPVGATGRDSTYEYGAFWDGGVERCIVIADELPDGDVSFLRHVDPQATFEVLRYRLPDRELIQARIDVGELDLPAQESGIRYVVRACEERGASTHWMQTSQRAGWPESRLPVTSG